MPLTAETVERIQELESAGYPLVSCLRCNQSYPETEEFWFFSGKQRSDFCRECTRMSKSEQASIPLPGDLLRKFVGGDILDSSGLCHLRDEVRLVFGGVRGIAAQLKLDYEAAKPGSNARVQLMKAILNLEAEADRSRKGTGKQFDLDPEDLLRVLEQTFGMKPKELEKLLDGSDQGRTG